MPKFKLQKTPRGKKKKEGFVMPTRIKDPADTPPFYIRGIKAASKEEYWVSLALTKFEKEGLLTWNYQVPIYGGRTRRGGLVIDFIVDIAARTFWLDPQGKYWHTGQKDDLDQLKRAALRRHVTLIAWYTEETPTKESMYTFLRIQLGL
jgi:hypothetical protein